ncbi:MAG TPA: nuclear transport factor 2 family protein [Miltoncostaea sp.]|nr:nuclear transport factor 2 family protein [Miltoncostaea sp.]
MTSPAYASRSALDVVVELGRLLAAGRLDAIRAMYHPDARLVTMASGPEPLPPDRAYEALMAALRRASYSPPPSIEPVAIDDVAALGSAHIRYPTPGGGHADVRRVWLFTVEDGLLFRSVPLQSESEARELYAREGRALGF